MSVINTNITSMIGQSNLNKSQNALQTSMERLSSGLRINSAKDDAAGQAIANRMTAQITGLAQAQRNANDGISVAQTAEGALNQINDNLQRIRELSVQSANDTNSANDLQSIQDEIDQRLAEIDRISEQTNFNGVDVLAKNRELNIQVGANDNEQITVNLKEITAETLKLNEFRVASDQEATLSQMKDQFNATLDLSYTDGTATYEVNDFGVVTDPNNGDTRVRVDSFSGDLTNDVTTANRGASDLTGTDLQNLGVFSAVEGEAAGTYTATTNGANGSIDVNITIDADGAVTAFQVRGAQTGTAIGDLADGDNLLLDAQGNLTTDATSDNAFATVADLESRDFEIDPASEVVIASGDFAGTYNLNADGQILNDSGVVMYLSQDADGNATLAAEGSQRTASTERLEALDAALNQVDSLRSELGAVQNRFEDAITNLNTNETNLAAARSRIEDADYAVEVANMTRAQILQQAGTSVLAQANQIPQNVLSLLG